MKRIFVFLLVFAMSDVNSSAAQTTITGIDVPAGTTKTLSKGQKDLIIGSLIMGDNSTLVVPEDFPYWNVFVEKAIIGTGARIDASGRNGKNRTGTPKKPPDAKRCSKYTRDKPPHGRRGSPSPIGETGISGTTITMYMGIETVGSLLIDTSGGRGGASGNGGPGGKAGRSDCTSSCYGGKGGDGGNARQSSGGNGGDINLYFWRTTDPSNTPTGPKPGIRFNADGGRPGILRHPGFGGEGAPRRRCRWPVANRQAQEDGFIGRRIPGRHGQDGSVTFAGMPIPKQNKNFSEDALLQMLFQDKNFE